LAALRIDGDPFHPQRSLAGQEMVVKRLRSDRRDQWPDCFSPYAGYSFLQSLSGSSTISYMTGLSKPSRAYLASRRPNNQKARCLQADSDTRNSMLAGPRSEEVGFAHDSALEGTGFEPSVPLEKRLVS
jgi:hypothetical protein